MRFHRYARPLVIAAIGHTFACSSQSTAPSSTVVNRASVAIVGLVATVEPLTTTPRPGLLYRLTYQLHESGGRMSATAVAQHLAFSNGQSGDSNFTAVTPPHVPPGGTITMHSTYSVYPATAPATRVTFTVTYTDAAAQSGTTTAEANVSPIGM